MISVGITNYEKIIATSETLYETVPDGRSGQYPSQERTIRDKVCKPLQSSGGAASGFNHPCVSVQDGFFDDPGFAVSGSQCIHF